MPIELSVKQLLNLATKDEFPHKMFLFNKQKFYLTPITHFFTSTRIFDTKPKTPIEFTCKIGNCKLRCKFCQLTNLNHHLYIHDDSRNWYKQYQQYRGNKDANVLTEGEMDLIKLFVSSFQSLSLLKNEYFRKLISQSVDIRSEFYFRYDFLHTVIQQLHNEIEKSLDKALIVTLTPDIWEKHFEHRLGLGALLVFDSFERQLLIIGVEIREESNAEAIKATTESIVNEYKFDKNKIKGNSEFKKSFNY